MKKTAHIERVRRDHARCRMEVMNILGWDDMAYASYQEEMGRRYIRLAVGDCELAEEITRHREYWSWWRIHWHRRDEEFLELAPMLFDSEKAGYYQELHDPEGMAFYPQSVILEKSYHTMIHRLVKEAVK